MHYTLLFLESDEYLFLIFLGRYLYVCIKSKYFRPPYAILGAITAEGAS